MKAAGSAFPLSSDCGPDTNPTNARSRLPPQTAVVQVSALYENLRHNRFNDPPMILILIVIVSYLIGSIPSGYLAAKSQGIDIRQHGSKNIGATNVLRVMGKKWGYLVFFCDGFKGFLAVRLGIFLGSFGGIESSIAGVVAAIACILGHNYTFWLGFKGGKGIATSGGVVLALFPWFIVLTVAVVWVVVFYLSKYVSLASICAAISLPVSLVLVSPWTGGSRSFWVLILFAILAAGLAVWRHRTNITRLLNGTESRFGKKKSES
jgi:acyl phosphate:glycerol-3-phosphate acyltransferase